MAGAAKNGTTRVQTVKAANLNDSTPIIRQAQICCPSNRTYSFTWIDSGELVIGKHAHGASILFELDP